MSWVSIASGLFASHPSELEGRVRVVVGLKEIVALMRDQTTEQSIIVTNVAGGSAVSTIIRRAKAIVSTIGGTHSHIVVVARDYNVPCIVGASTLDLNAIVDGSLMRLGSDGTIYIAQGAEPDVPLDELRLLRLIVFAGAVEALHYLVGFEGEDIQATAASLTRRGLVESDTIIAPTAAGLEALERWYEVDRRELNEATQNLIFEQFQPLDKELKRIASQWQDAERLDDWDARMETVEALTKLNDATQALVQGHASALPRLTEFAGRLTRAYDKVVDGQTNFLVGVEVDSYHTTWSQLHEDLLCILKRERDPND